MSGNSDDLDEAPLTIIQARWKLMLAEIACLCVVALGVWSLGGGDESAMSGLILIPSFGLVAIVQGIRLVRPAQLTLGPSGIAFSSPFRVQDWAWTELEAIDLDSFRASQWVSLREKPSADSARGRFAAWRVGPSTRLPAGWPMSAADLRRLLQNGMARWG